MNLLRGFHSNYVEYSTFLKDNFYWLASLAVYIALILTAMQVGLATKYLAASDTFQAASYGFTVFAILGPLGGLLSIAMIFLLVFIDNFHTHEDSTKEGCSRFTIAKAYSRYIRISQNKQQSILYPRTGSSTSKCTIYNQCGSFDTPYRKTCANRIALHGHNAESHRLSRLITINQSYRNYEM